MPTDQNGSTIIQNTAKTANTQVNDIDLSLNLEASTPEDNSAKPEITLDIGDDRLAKEDKITEENLKPTTTKTTETVIEQTIPVEQVIEQKVVEVANKEDTKQVGKISNLFVEIEPEATKEIVVNTPVFEATVIETPTTEQPTIIEHIATQTTPVITETPTIIETPIAQTPVVQTPTIQQSINLDDILGNTPTTTIPTTPVVSNIPMVNPITNEVINTQTVLPVFNTNPTTNNTNTPIPTYNVPISNMQNKIAFETKSISSKKLLINITLGILIFVGLGFIFKTMYPIQYNSLLGINKIENSIDNNITNGVITETPVDNSGTNQIVEGIITDTGSLANNTTNEIHGSAQEQSGFDAFADINQATEDTIDIEAIKTKLQGYIDSGKKARVIAKKTNDKELLKNSLYLWKKTESFMNRIATGEEITNDEITQQMDKFEESLKSLNTVDAETVSGENTVSQEPIPSPADFFSNEKDQQTGTEIQATTGSETTETTTGQDITGSTTQTSGDMIQ